MADMTIVFIVLGLTVVLFAWNRFPVEIVAMSAALALAATGVLTVPESLSGFGDLTVIYIAALFIVSEGIDATGVTTWAGQQLTMHAGDSPRRLTVMMMALVAVLTAIISVNGAVAAMIPMVVVIALRMRRSPSSLLLPLAFGAHAGSLLVLTGTPIHILVIDAAVDAGAAPFNFFEFALIGLPLVIGTIALVVLLGPRLLPDRNARSAGADLGDHARTLIEQYSLTDWVARLEVGDGSELVGRPPADLPLGSHPDLQLVGVQGVRGVTHPLDQPIQVGFVITVRGDADAVRRFADQFGLRRLPGKTGGSLINREIGAVELIIPPRSPLIGEEVFPGMITASGNVVVLAIHRNGEHLTSTPITLASGDILLAQGTWEALDAGTEGADELLVVDAPSAVRRQAVPLSAGAKRALVILAGMVVLLATGAVPAAVAALSAAGAMILTGVLTMKDAYRAISWTTVVLVAAMIPLSQAVISSGAAEAIADRLVAVVGDLGPHALLLGIFLVTAVFGQLISNTATALIVIPIAVTAANHLGVSVRPVLMCVTVAAAAAFLTPVATPANLMIMQPGGYRFGDYWRLGLPILVLFGVAAVGLVPVFWPF